VVVAMMAIMALASVARMSIVCSVSISGIVSLSNNTATDQVLGWHPIYIVSHRGNLNGFTDEGVLTS